MPVTLERKIFLSEKEKLVRKRRMVKVWHFCFRLWGVKANEL